MSPANFQPVPHVPTWLEIEHASQVIRDAVHVTPMLHSRTFGTMTGANVYLKPEICSEQDPSRCVEQSTRLPNSVRRNAGAG